MAALLAAPLSPRLIAQDGDAPSEVAPVAPVAPVAHAYELAGAFANDGFQVRDGHWEGVVPAGGALIAVTLYSGNSYWFCAAVAEDGKAPSVLLFDENGNPLEGERYAEGNHAAFLVKAPHSGRYFARLGGDGEPATPGLETCFLYLYK